MQGRKQEMAMDGLKKNLHFVVFGVGVLIGLVLMVVGMLIKSGKQDAIGESTATLAKHALPTSKLPTKKDADIIKRKKGAFENEIKSSMSALESGPGVALKADRKVFRDGSSFFSEEGDVAVKALQARFMKLEKEIELPAELGGRKLTNPVNAAAASPFWKKTLDEMNAIADPKAIPNFQAQIRIMQEVCFLCEQLLKQKAFAGQGVRLVEFKWEFRGMEAIAAESPWEDYPFVVILECQPGFATAFADELVNASKATMGDSTKAKEGLGRWGFPVELVEMQIELMERPSAVTANIYNKDKAAYGIPETAKSDDPIVEQKKKELEDKLLKDLNLGLPVRCGVRAKALAFNKEWRGVKAAPENN